MSNDKKKTERTMSTGGKLLAILLLSCSAVAFAVTLAFAFIDILSLILAVPSGLIAFTVFLILLTASKLSG